MMALKNVHLLGNPCHEGTIHVLTVFYSSPINGHPHPHPGLPPWASFSWSPGGKQNQEFQGRQVWGSSISVSIFKKMHQAVVFWQLLCRLLNTYIHRLLSSHHWAWLLGSNYLIISQTSRVHPDWASLSFAGWLIASKLSCLEGADPCPPSWPALEHRLGL